MTNFKYNSSINISGNDEAVLIMAGFTAYKGKYKK
jgi:hypothetical protein